MASAFLILTKDPAHKAMRVAGSYSTEAYRDTVLELKREKYPERLYVAQNPADNEREDARRTT